MSESALRALFKRKLSPYARVVRMESAISAGVPDEYVCARGMSAWVELKHMDAWPVRVSTPVRCPRLRLEQVAWLEEEDAAGGRAFLLLQVGREYLLFWPSGARLLWEGVSTHAAIIGAAATLTEEFTASWLLRSMFRWRRG